ncbi:hypothetical protein [Flagellimonas sp. CMM7]|uniref:hypothetical protein n=1 Tax=Flagellimonas sp. CMM7 TaxID=2654676 RepID=UPI0013D12BA1|nr:hypothetical protein [Flagellimonas sp. CMM7]UII79886.1 hypothetical protein LV704_19780 [Flagellimonas sp. CMM7]
MKKEVTSFLIAFIFMFLSCSKSDDTQPPPPEESDLVAATLSFPTNNLICTNFQLEFRWSNNNTGAVENQIEISKEQNFTNPIIREVVTATFKIFTLEKNTTYYWRMVSKRPGSETSVASEIWKFDTEPNPVSNNIPYGPTILGPTNGITVSGNTANLSWNAQDADNDPLTYDVYFGTSNPPPLLAAGVTQTSRNVDLQGAGTYYWRIVVKDDKQSAAIGQVWNFTAN